MRALASLARAGKECCALSMGITLGEDGEIADVTVTPSLVKVLIILYFLMYTLH